MSAQELAAFVTSRPAEAFEALWRVTLQALGAWFLTAPLIVAVVFLALRPVLRGVARRLRSGTAAGAEPALGAVPVSRSSRSRMIADALVLRPPGES